MPTALLRPLSPRITECELTHLDRTPIDFEAARRQHAEYEAALRSLGFAIEHLPELLDHPDGVFVEDTALVLPEVAVITRPGAKSRQGETASVAAALSGFRSLVTIEAPGTLDGGDVLVLGRVIYVGSSLRSNEAGIAQLASLLSPWGYRVEGVPLTGCLHLKSAVTEVAPGRLLLNPAWVSKVSFPGQSFIEVDPAEPAAANALRIGRTLLYPKAHTRTRARLENAGLRVLAVDQSELAKAEGGVTCCSLILPVADTDAFTVRRVEPRDVPACITLEARCFPPEEAASPERVRLRAEVFPDGFLVAEDPRGEIVGLVMSGATEKEDISDEALKELIGHDPAGTHAVVLSVAVLPAFEGSGLGRRLLEEFAGQARAAGRQSVLLLCKSPLVPWYERLGYRDQGPSASTHGGATWHQMKQDL